MDVFIRGVNMDKRTESIVNHLRVAKAYPDYLSSPIDAIKVSAEDIKNYECDGITKSKVFSELAAYFATLSAQQLSQF